MPAKKKDNVNRAELDANSAKPLQKLLTNAAEAPFEGGLAKSYVMTQPPGDYYDEPEALTRGTLFKSLDDEFEI